VPDDADELERALDRLAAVAHAVIYRELQADTRTRFRRYAHLLHLWNQTHNLTALRSPADIVRGLFEDSLLFLRVLPAEVARIVDIGAGAGIPSVPMHLVQPRVSILLIEARRKRVSFLRALKRELQLDDRVTILEGRAESLIQTHPEYRSAAEVAVARAVTGSRDLTRIAHEYVKPGGVLISAGPPATRTEGRREPELRLVELPQLGVRRAFGVSRV
jgi:16S rRNA (guanine527-N7)-methyltransferase